MNEHLQTVAVSDYLKKGLDILISNSSNPMALEALVQALEATLEGKQYDGSGVVLEAAVEAHIKPKHPLEDYKITEKDIGSLVLVWDGVKPVDASVTSLGDVREEGHYPVKSYNGCGWQYARPHLDPISLHFKPWHATEEDVPPSDLEDGKWYAMLMEDGSIDISCYPTEWNWNSDDSPIIGYRPLSFVNPILDEEK